jgi:hypothetical protein
LQSGLVGAADGDLLDAQHFEGTLHFFSGSTK